MTRKLGHASLTMLSGGDFRLDGGAMHGVVPKTIWSRLVSCDDRNRVAYSTNCLLVEIGGKRVLVETGNGDKFSPKEKEIYGIDHERSISGALAEIGIAPAAIDVVVLTHLHFDHAGGTTRRVPGGVEPVFPRARHVVQRREFVAAEHAHERNRASYLAENFAPLAAAGLLNVVDDATEILPGLRVIPTPGHTPGHQSVIIDGGNGECAVFFGDVVPTSIHVRLPFIMAYDLDVEATLAAKKRLLADAIDGHWLVLWGHDLRHGGFLIRDDKGQPAVGEIVEV